MAEGNKGGNTGLALLVGGLVVVVIVIAWFLFAGGNVPNDTQDVNIDVSVPDAPSVPAPSGN
ncbi:MAG: hypothetical protein ACK4E3_01490 [Brevundimonas sp.]|uniref:hypothetical protein n=1 Tax=Brevundimonas sp. TaxID=1871086 RepID=UPI00391A6189